LNPQVRLYQHARVDYIEAIHTAGFQASFSDFAPQDAYFLHFDCILKSPAERLEKVRRYEVIKPGFGWKFGYHYLPDLFPEVDQRARALEAPEFNALFAALPTPKSDRATLTLAEHWCGPRETP
jgi:hypothetical protein